MATEADTYQKHMTFKLLPLTGRIIKLVNKRYFTDEKTIVSVIGFIEVI